MGDKKLWNRADVRAEMNRLVKSTTDACKVIHAANAAIEALGKETGFEDDATRAWAELRRRVFPPGAKAALRGDYSELLPPLPKAPPAKSEVQRVLETWGAQGCTCAASVLPVTVKVKHPQVCPIYLEKMNAPHVPYERVIASSISSALAMLPKCPQGVWISKRVGWDKSEADYIVHYVPAVVAWPFHIKASRTVFDEGGLRGFLASASDAKVLLVPEENTNA